ncbi:MAG: hypothetical protein HC854_11435 [Flavobacterium sp.]|nr:hypothetical protein [Flavobacterium sp.]
MTSYIKTIKDEFYKTVQYKESRYKFILASISLFLVSCFGWYGNQDDVFPQSNNFVPVIMDRTDFETSVALLPPKNIVNSGKIYIQQDYLFINEVNEGFHVFNYSNPSNPIPIAYIKTVGATDIALRNNTLYINQAVDLLTLKYNDENNTIEVTNRNRNVFPQKISPEGFSSSVANNEIIVNWVEN